MGKLQKIILSFILLSFSSLTVVANVWQEDFVPAPVIQDGNTMIIEIVVNGTKKIILEGVPKEGNLEIFNLLGVKVKTMKLNACKEGCYIALPKGLYVIKAGEVSRKTIVE